MSQDLANGKGESVNSFHVPLVVVLLLLVVTAPGAFPQEAPVDSGPSRDRALWVASAIAFGASLGLDRPVRTLMSRQHSHTLDDVANAVNPMGTAGTIVPALVVSYGLARVTRHGGLAARVLRVGIGYAASDAFAGAVRSAVGRARPSLNEGPWRFRPFSFESGYSSFPSGHVVHVASLATGIADQANSGWVTAVAATAVALVGVQRLYRDQHWTSDVVGGAVLSDVTTVATLGWLRQRGWASSP